MNRLGRPRAVLFDLDGTLVHSSPDIAAALNALMQNHGLSAFSLGEVETMIGHGLRTLTARAFAARNLPLSERDLDHRFAAMMAIYPDHLTNLTRLNSHAREALAACREAGVASAVVTNKPVAFAHAILDCFSLLSLVDNVVGGDSGHPKKPAPDMLLAACSTLDVVPAQAVMVGDSGADAMAAAAAGMTCVLIEGGYSQLPLDSLGAALVLPSLERLAAVLDLAPP